MFARCTRACLSLFATCQKWRVRSRLEMAARVIDTSIATFFNSEINDSIVF
jgi:hypothetical protein